MTLAQNPTAGQPAQMPPGWYPSPNDPPGVLRWWNGQAWGPETMQQQAAVMPAPQVVIPAPYTMTTRSHKDTSHGLHLFLSIITGGAWALFVWLPITIWHRSHKGEKTVTTVGY